MTDWADEIATQLFDTFIVTDIIVEPIAAALRKAKADGRDEQIPAGYVLVPIEPTEAMRLAGNLAEARLSQANSTSASEVYRAMIAAAKLHPSS